MRSIARFVGLGYLGAGMTLFLVVAQFFFNEINIAMKHSPALQVFMLSLILIGVGTGILINKPNVKVMVAEPPRT